MYNISRKNYGSLLKNKQKRLGQYNFISSNSLFQSLAEIMENGNPGIVEAVNARNYTINGRGRPYLNFKIIYP